MASRGARELMWVRVPRGFCKGDIVTDSTADPRDEELEERTDPVDAEDVEGTEGSEDAGAEQSAGRPDKQTALDEEGDIAADYLEELLDIADLDGDIDTFTEGGRAHVSVVTEATVLVGKDGEVLEALQELARLAVMTETGKRSRLMLDIAGHREKRRRELTDLANDAVQEVKDAGEPVRLNPMNPFERKIVHDVVAAAGLSSESDGEEPNRRVVVLPA
jgi:spoIIIJ-associated protein